MFILNKKDKNKNEAKKEIKDYGHISKEESEHKNKNNTIKIEI